MAVVAVALLLHVRTLGFGFTYLDDNVLIVDDQAFLSQPSSVVGSFGRTYFQAASTDHAYYRPLVNASYGLDANLGGASPRGYHRTNILLHALAAGLLYLLLRRLGQRDNVALFGGLLFATHPALTEAVAWIPGRNDSLLAVFAFASWLCLLRAWEPGRWVSRIGHPLLWLCALLCKETAVALPVVCVAHLLLVERRSWRSLLAPWLLAGWVAALAIYLAARAAVVPDHVGTHGVSSAAMLANLSLFPSSLGKLVLPVHLSVLAVPEDTWLWPGFLGAGLFAALFFIPKIRRASLWLSAICFAAFIVPGVPASNLLVLENRLYLPAFGIVLLACELASCLAWSARVKLAAGTIVVALLAAMSFSYAGNFSDRLTFNQAAVRMSPHSSLAHRNLGVTLHTGGDENSAWREYEAALAEDKGEPVAHNNLAVILMAHGRLADAEPHLRQELTINPSYIPAHRNLALVLRGLGRRDEAAVHWQSILDLGSPGAEAASELAAYWAARDPAKAEQYRRMLENRTGGRP